MVKNNLCHLRKAYGRSVEGIITAQSKNYGLSPLRDSLNLDYEGWKHGVTRGNDDNVRKKKINNQ